MITSRTRRAGAVAAVTLVAAAVLVTLAPPASAAQARGGAPSNAHLAISAGSGPSVPQSVVAALCALVGRLGVAVRFCTQLTGAESQRFHFTQDEQQFVVPAGATSINVELTGGRGGAGGSAVGGNGARVFGAIAVKQDQVLFITVAGQGGDANGDKNPGNGAYGYAGSGGRGGSGHQGGTDGAGGGGSTALEIADCVSCPRTLVAVAGGGGGGGGKMTFYKGGAGGTSHGSATGSSGVADPGWSVKNGGTGGSGGTAGPATPGGNGQDGNRSSESGGGGGGGGGAGAGHGATTTTNGGSGAGGGAGLSATYSLLTNPQVTRGDYGVQTDNVEGTGTVNLSWTD